MIEKKLNVLASVKPKEYDDNVNFDLDKFALNGLSAEMEKQLLDDKFILGRIAILGQCSVIYAQPGTGKTLLVLALLCKSIEKGDINAKDVYYINADDDFRGLVNKLKIAEEYGFWMLVPGMMLSDGQRFDEKILINLLRSRSLNDKARGKVLVLDTLKKFAEVMSKSQVSNFMKWIRGFVSNGGSVILLAHVNKNRNEEGGVIYAGTADVVDDTDCAYTLDEIAIDKSKGMRSVKFSNIKARGDNAIEAVYEYSIAKGASYYEKLKSVRLLGDEEKNAAIKRKIIEQNLNNNDEAIQIIKDVIRRGITKKTEIIKAAMEEGLSNRAVKKVLKAHEGSKYADGQLWRVKIGPDNAHIYSLNLKNEWGV